MERSIGKKFTEEYAVMVDPFRPLKITEEALKVEDHHTKLLGWKTKTIILKTVLRSNEAFGDWLPAFSTKLLSKYIED
jgi:hypothetical protein